MHVQQRSPHDCALACIAMAVGKTYDAAWTLTETARVNVTRGVAEYAPWMELQGLKRDRDWREVYVGGARHASALLWGRRAILSVHSLNNDGGHHAVYWDGYDLHDPSTNLQYTWLHSCVITRAILLLDAERRAESTPESNFSSPAQG